MKTPEEFLAKVREYGVTIERIQLGSGLITLSKLFTPGSAGAYARVEGEVGIIYSVPQTQPGTTWGTDGASIGGHVAMQNGKMILNRSGCSKRFLAKLEKLLAEDHRAYKARLVEHVVQGLDPRPMMETVRKIEEEGGTVE
jgi:hypothetical protein